MRMPVPAPTPWKKKTTATTTEGPPSLATPSPENTTASAATTPPPPTMRTAAPPRRFPPAVAASPTPASPVAPSPASASPAPSPRASPSPRPAPPAARPPSTREEDDDSVQVVEEDEEVIEDAPGSSHGPGGDEEVIEEEEAVEASHRSQGGGGEVVVAEAAGTTPVGSDHDGAQSSSAEPSAHGSSAQEPSVRSEHEPSSPAQDTEHDPSSAHDAGQESPSLHDAEQEESVHSTTARDPSASGDQDHSHQSSGEEDKEEEPYPGASSASPMTSEEQEEPRDQVADDEDGNAVYGATGVAAGAAATGALDDDDADLQEMYPAEQGEEEEDVEEETEEEVEVGEEEEIEEEEEEEILEELEGEEEGEEMEEVLEEEGMEDTEEEIIMDEDDELLMDIYHEDPPPPPAQKAGKQQYYDEHGQPAPQPLIYIDENGNEVAYFPDEAQPAEEYYDEEPVPMLDEYGNPVVDEYGNVVYQDAEMQALGRELGDTFEDEHSADRAAAMAAAGAGAGMLDPAAQMYNDYDNVDGTSQQQQQVGRAAPAAADPQKPKRGGLCSPTWGKGVFLLAMIALVVTAVVLLVDDDDDAPRELPPAPTPSPSQVPTMLPTTSGKVTSAPTMTPGAPTTAVPGPTPQPTPGPGPGPAPAPIELEPIQVFAAASPNSTFGTSLAMSQLRLGIGAPTTDGSGSVLTYARANGARQRQRHLQSATVEFGDTWELLEELSPLDQAGADFGHALDFTSTGRGLLVGAPGAYLLGSTAITIGSAYFYTFSRATGSWVQEGSVMQGGASITNSEERFGTAVATSDTDRVVIGAPGYGENNEGRLYTFEVQQVGSAFDWVQVDAPMGSEANAAFGSSVDISLDGYTMVVGSPGVNKAHIYEWNENGDVWELAFEATRDDSSFGASVVILSDNFVAVGSPSERSDRGAVRLYSKETGSWDFHSVVYRGGFGESVGAPGTIDGSIGDDGPEIVFGTATGFVQRFDYIGDAWVRRFNEDVGTAVSSVILSPSDENPAVVVGSIDAGEVVVYSKALPDQPTPSPAGEPTVSPTTAPTMLPTKFVAGSGWQISNGPISVGQEGTEFGYTVAVDSGLLAVGSPAFPDSGAVQSLERVGNEWVQLSVAYESDSLEFGRAIDVGAGEAMSTMVIGAPESDDPTFQQTFGAAYFYELQGESWNLVGEALRPEPLPVEFNGRFGAAVATAPDQYRVAVGAPDSNLDISTRRVGRVFTFEYDGTNWNYMADPFVGETAEGQLGTAVDMSRDGSRVLIGAPGDDDGEVYYYEWRDGAWTVLFTLSGGDVAGSQLGSAVRILSDDGNRIALGGPSYQDGRGVVVVYEKTNDNRFFRKVGSDIVGAAAGEAVGSTLTGNGGRLVVGHATGFRAYDFNGTDWEEVGNGPTVDSTVESLAASKDGSSIVVGMTNEEVVIYTYY